jgi:hypothetical protein
MTEVRVFFSIKRRVEMTRWKKFGEQKYALEHIVCLVTQNQIGSVDLCTLPLYNAWEDRIPCHTESDRICGSVHVTIVQCMGGSDLSFWGPHSGQQSQGPYEVYHSVRINNVSRCRDRNKVNENMPVTENQIVSAPFNASQH